jgi:hypothetical protein
MVFKNRKGNKEKSRTPATITTGGGGVEEEEGEHWRGHGGDILDGRKRRAWPQIVGRVVVAEALGG